MVALAVLGHPLMGV